jgi:hypothetical protein
VTFEQRSFGSRGDYKPVSASTLTTNRLDEQLWQKGLYLRGEVLGTFRPGRTAPRLLFSFDTEEVIQTTAEVAELFKKVTRGRYYVQKYISPGFISLYLKPPDIM